MGARVRAGWPHTLALLPGTEVQSTVMEPSMWAGETASMRCEAFDLHALPHTIGVGVRTGWPHTSGLVTGRQWRLPKTCRVALFC